MQPTEKLSRKRIEWIRLALLLILLFLCIIWEVSKITVVDTTCHQPVIYDVTVNNCYL